MKTKTIIAALLLAIVCIWLGYILAPPLQRAFNPPQNESFSEEDWQLFNEVLTRLQNDYLEKDVTPQQLMEGVLKGMVNSLGDPYSQYLNPEEYKDWTAQVSGNYGGVGMEIGAKNSKPTVISVFPGSPAEKAGIRSGDHFVKIDEEYVESWSVSEIASKVRGEPGTQVKLVLERGGDLLEFTLTRELITVQTVSFRMIENDTGYIQLLGFKEGSAADFQAGLDQLVRQGAKKLILDMRQNPGGLISSVIDISSMLIPAGEPIVIIEDRDGNKKISRSSSFLPKYNFDKIVVLVDAGTASAAEILAGALQDYKLATLIGEKTFGKGIVQTLEQLPGGSALILTTSRYLTPSGRSIHKIGIQPDIEVIPSVEDLEQGKDPVLEKALEFIKS